VNQDREEIGPNRLVPKAGADQKFWLEIAAVSNVYPS